MRSDERLLLFFVGLFVVVLLLDVGTALPRRHAAPTTPSSAPSSTTYSTGISVTCLDAHGYPVRTDVDDARRAHLECPQPERKP